MLQETNFKKFLHICSRTHSCVTSHIVPLTLLVHKGGPVKYDCQPSSPHTCSAHLQQATWIMHSDYWPVLSSLMLLAGFRLQYKLPFPELTLESRAHACEEAITNAVQVAVKKFHVLSAGN